MDLPSYRKAITYVYAPRMDRWRMHAFDSDCEPTKRVYLFAEMVELAVARDSMYHVEPMHGLTRVDEDGGSLSTPPRSHYDT